jgi:regulator of replication initiation timing
MKVAVMMNEWQRDVGLALAAFIGGRLTNFAGTRLQQQADTRRNVDRLVDALGEIRTDLAGIKSEIHEQLREAKSELSVSLEKMRCDLTNHRDKMDARLEHMDNRIDRLSQSRMDAPWVASMASDKDAEG